jgi:hypothetical protein
VKLCSSTSLVRRLPAIPCISLGNSVRGAVRDPISGARRQYCRLGSCVEKQRYRSSTRRQCDEWRILDCRNRRLPEANRAAGAGGDGNTRAGVDISAITIAPPSHLVLKNWFITLYRRHSRQIRERRCPPPSGNGKTPSRQ